MDQNILSIKVPGNSNLGALSFTSETRIVNWKQKDEQGL